MQGLTTKNQHSNHLFSTDPSSDFDIRISYFNRFGCFMQNKPNLSLRRQGSSNTISPFSTRRYKNFTRHSVSEGGPIQTQSNPKTKPFFLPKTAPKPKTNPIQTKTNPILKGPNPNCTHPRLTNPYRNFKWINARF
jgi:hypothetical protein